MQVTASSPLPEGVCAGAARSGDVAVDDRVVLRAVDAAALVLGGKNKEFKNGVIILVLLYLFQMEVYEV